MAWVLSWLIFANFAGFAIMVYDKKMAERGGWRVSENTLILWSVLGGSAGTLAAQYFVRHKTRKQPIASNLRMIPCLHLACFGAWYIAGDWPWDHMGSVTANGVVAERLEFPDAPS